jgi:hybrid cluster-associated redox disulfide protein
MMTRPSGLILPDSRLSDLMREQPQTIPVFLRHHMVCVGCWMSKFDTVADAVWNYGLDMETFLRELNQSDQSVPPKSADGEA